MKEVAVTYLEKQIDRVVELLEKLVSERDYTKSDESLFIEKETDKRNLKKTSKKETDKQGKICKTCGKIHDKPIDYANCARLHKNK